MASSIHRFRTASYASLIKNALCRSTHVPDVVGGAIGRSNRADHAYQAFGCQSSRHGKRTVCDTPYQRRYSWREPQIGDLYDDINLIEEGDTHLLGSIVCLTGFHQAGINQLELVDGQQRITTLLIVMECIRERMKREGDPSAHELDRLLSSRSVDGNSAPKLLLESLDADEFRSLAANELDRDFRNDNLATAFRLVREWVADADIGEVRRFAYRLQNQAVIIRLDVAEAKDAFKLFEVINNRGLKLSSTDIVKNFLLGNAARFGKADLEAARRRWSELVAYLDGVNSDTFLRYYLVARQKRRVTASHVVNSFKELFMTEVDEAAKLPDRHQFVDDDSSEEEQVVEGGQGASVVTTTPKEFDQNPSKVSFAAFLGQLVMSSKVYAELVLAGTGSIKVDRALRSLRMIRAYQTYGFLMHLRVGGCNDKDFLEILRLTESLMLRRQVCRERSNENDWLFGSLCTVDPQKPVEETRLKYREACPSDEKFEAEFASTSYNPNLMDRARYCLERIELNLHGEHEELDLLGPDAVHVEHIIPQKIKSKRAKEESGDWLTYLGPKAEVRHASYVGRIGNLTLFAGDLNISASNNPFHRKRTAYKKSGIKMNASLATMQNFRFDQVEKRSRELANVAAKLWPMP
ncbi:DUF262 domain-containing protein [Tahibacter amnicola]|uniref:DUF262 domain-containing HNH endonuclease family protein n=1 Tax=Tahibacter amnicola TaxID=2976241 RepID=A0ABY6B813_9GAMM|nr:DUF262 domain-containing HNH endonuclease family protein [Tahibacter amnicola]UXI66154.1 DUF262 domain-containing HNH endonuclease family protein [Tahibacter amnicola]